MPQEELDEARKRISKLQNRNTQLRGVLEAVAHDKEFRLHCKGFTQNLVDGVLLDEGHLRKVDAPHDSNSV